MYILGISAYHGDCSACLIKDGKIIAAVEEERFKRIKHWAGFPEESITYCLNEANISMNDVHYIGVGRDPKAHLFQKLRFVLFNWQSKSKLKSRWQNRAKIVGITKKLSELYETSEEKIRQKLYKIEHHKAHMASSFLISPYNKAAILSIDSFGDFVSTMQGLGKDNDMDVMGFVSYPHSLGLFYTAVTQFLGFDKYGDEYKVMGLAPYGEPRLKSKLRRVINYNGGGKFCLNLKYFRHYRQGVEMTWEDGEPTMGPVYSSRFVEDFGFPRKRDEELNSFHKDLAASLQSITEDIIFKLLNDLFYQTRIKNLCLAGGVALNSVANGKIFDNSPFEEIYIQPAAGDAGTSLGAAYYIYNIILNKPRDFVMRTSYWGPGFEDSQIDELINKKRKDLENKNCEIERMEDKALICKKTAQKIADGKVVGWFQGRMEWGPRALGNRSILVDPRRSDMKDVLNDRIKRREPFRPFAPSILEEATGEYFEKGYLDPFMIKVYSIRPDKHSIIPAVTHVDGSGRLQTVNKEENPLYWKLIKEFENLTGIPIVLNTSFNENEPIVNTPNEALDCFLRTRMDVLVLKNFVICKSDNN